MCPAKGCKCPFLHSSGLIPVRTWYKSSTANAAKGSSQTSSRQPRFFQVSFLCAGHGAAAERAAQRRAQPRRLPRPAVPLHGARVGQGARRPRRGRRSSKNKGRAGRPQERACRSSRTQAFGAPTACAQAEVGAEQRGRRAAPFLRRAGPRAEACLSAPSSDFSRG